MPVKIPADSTIESVWDSLAHPEDYVRNIRHKMMLCKNKYGNAHVKIGVTGKGLKPCYRVSYQNGADNTIHGSYWDNHQPLEKEDADTANWSTSSMNFEQVDEFLKHKINWKGKP